MVPMDSRDSEGVPFASPESLWPGIWQGAEKWSWDITKIENLHINTRKKFTDSKNAILFDQWRKVTKLSRKKTASEKWRHKVLAAFSACHSSRRKHRNRILSYFFDLQNCLHKYTRLVQQCRYAHLYFHLMCN